VPYDVVGGERPFWLDRGREILELLEGLEPETIL
jgi:hypothetical protein